MKNHEYPSRRVRSTLAGLFVLISPVVFDMPNALAEQTPRTEQTPRSDVGSLEEFSQEINNLCKRVYFDSDGELCHQDVVSASPQYSDQDDKLDIAVFRGAAEELGDRLRFDQ